MDYESMARRLLDDCEKIHWQGDIIFDADDLEKRIVTALRDTADPLEKEIEHKRDWLVALQKDKEALEERVRELEEALNGLIDFAGHSSSELCFEPEELSRAKQALSKSRPCEHEYIVNKGNASADMNYCTKCGRPRHES